MVINFENLIYFSSFNEPKNIQNKIYYLKISGQFWTK